jgi:iron-sulfur cluster assembly protein
MITVSEKAKERLERLKVEEGKPEAAFLRVGVAGGGCSGLSYKLDFDTEIKPGDQIFNDNDFQVVVDMKSFLYLAGTELNYDDSLNGKGFEFQNPNASRTCACGESFAV